MSSLSPLPSREDNYRWRFGMLWSRQTYAATIEDLGARAVALEAQKATVEDLIEELKTFGLVRLDEALMPLIDEQRAILVALKAEIEQALAATSGLVEDFETRTGAALDQFGLNAAAAVEEVTVSARDKVTAIEADIAAVRTRIDEILAGGLSAADVNETAARVFVTPAQRAKIDTPDWEPWQAFYPPAGQGAYRMMADREQIVFRTDERVGYAVLPGEPLPGMAFRVQRAGANAVSVGNYGESILTKKGMVDFLDITIDGLSLELARDATNSFWVWR